MLNYDLISEILEKFDKVLQNLWELHKFINHNIKNSLCVPIIHKMLLAGLDFK